MLIEEEVAGEPIGRDLRGIDVGFLYRASRLRLVSLEQRPVCATDPGVVDLLRAGAGQACADDGGVSDHDSVVADIPVEALRFWAYLPIGLAASGYADGTPSGASATSMPDPSATSPPDPPRWPPRISTLNYDGCVPTSEADEYVEIENLSANDVPLHGWILFSDTGG